MLPRRRRDRQTALDAEVWGDAVAEAIHRRELDAAAARPRAWRRVTGHAWRSRAQLVPVVILAGLFALGLGIRAVAFPWPPVAAAGAFALVCWWWFIAIGARSPAASMLRPALAVAYLVASAVIA